MKKKDYSITFLFDQPAADVFQAICNVRGWWSQTVKGRSQKLNDSFVYEHKPYHRSKQRVIEVVPDKKIVWLVTESNIYFVEDPNEWLDTEISFVLSKQKSKTKLVFTHHGLTSQKACFENCAKGWDYYLEESLARLITTGKGRPDKK